MSRLVTLASLLLLATLALGGETIELHAENYDSILEKSDEVLVHFFAPCKLSTRTAFFPHRTLTHLNTSRVLPRREQAVRQPAAAPGRYR